MFDVFNAVPGILTFTNTYSADKEYVKNIALAELTPFKDSDVWNTGNSMTGYPLSDEDRADIGKAIVVDPQTWAAKHIAAIQIFRTNTYIYLTPGSVLNLKVETAEAAAYYLAQIKDYEFVTVERFDLDEHEDPVIGLKEYYTVTMDGNGGLFESEDDEDKTTFVYGVLVGKTLSDMEYGLEDNTPDREGYEFSGWSDTPDATESTEFTDDTPVTSDKVFYAMWTAVVGD